MFIGLLTTLLIAGGLFFVLKPPGQGADSSSKFNSPISQAQQAVLASQSAAAKAEHAAGSTTPGPSATPAQPVKPATQAPVHPAVTHPVVRHATSALPKLAPGDHSRKVLAALANHHVAVLLFWTKGAADDNSVRRAVASIRDRRRVSTFTIAMADVGKYPAITTGVPISVSPTVLVIGPNHQYQKIAGYTDAMAIGQAIDLARG
jgi:hypothetical protein